MSMNIEPVKCKYCDSTDMKRYGTYNGVQLWWCVKCERKQTSKDTLFKMRYPKEQISTALRLYYEGLSVDQVQEVLEKQDGTHVATSSLYEWIQEFTNEAIKRAKEFKPKVGDEWIADETALIVRGKEYKGKYSHRYYWLFDVIDTKTRFVLATRLTPTRSIADVEAVMNDAARTAGKLPDRILTDKMTSYPEGIKLSFGGQVKHIQTKPFVNEDHTNVVERFHGTLKDRVKILRGFKSVDTAKQLLDGWLVYYNFFRKHESLDNQSPAEHMHIELPFTSWADIVKDTKERVIEPEHQTVVTPMSYRFTEDDFRKNYFTQAQTRHRAKVRQANPPRPRGRPPKPKSTLSSIRMGRRPK